MRKLLSLLAILFFFFVSCASSNEHFRPLTHPDSTTCEVHQEEMKREKVPVVYGLPAWGPKQKEMWEASKTLFPNSNRYARGGCVVGWRSPKKARVYYCPRCREAEEAWKKEHGYKL